MWKLQILGVMAHGDEPTGQVATDPWSIILVVLASLAASMVPLVLGFLMYNVIKRQETLSKENYLIPTGFSFGVLLFLLFDYASLSSIFVFQLDSIVFQSVKMLIVILILYVLAAVAGTRYDEYDTSKLTRYIFLVWAIGIFIHTIGEGIIMGYNLTQGIAAVFDPFSITSYMLHKFAEGIIGATLYAFVETEDKGLLYKTAGVAGISILPGALLGYLAGILAIDNFLSTLNIIVFTIGFAITVFIIPSIIPSKEELHKENYFIAVALALLYMYVGVILHNI